MTDEIIENAEMQVENDEIITGDDNTTSTAEEVVSEPEPLSIPDNWEPGIKDFITGIENVDAQKTFFDKFKNFDDGFQTKFQDLGQQRKDFEEQQQGFENDKVFLDEYRGFEQKMNPEHMTAIKAQYGNVPNYMNSLLSMDVMASQDPKKFLMNYCANNGITTESLQQVLSSPEAAQHTQAQDMGNMEAKIMQQVEEKFKREQLEKEINSFVGQVDEGGNLAHPHFEAVKNAIGVLEGAYPDKSLKELYDMACYADPSIRSDLMSQQVQSQAKTLNTQSEVAKAKQVTGAKPSAGSANINKKTDWRTVITNELAGTGSE